MRKAAFVVLIAALTGCTPIVWGRSAALKAHPEWSSAVVESINKGTISTGMDREMVAASWGNPESKLTIAGLEQWNYGGCTRFGCKFQWLHFSADGLLVSIDSLK